MNRVINTIWTDRMAACEAFGIRGLAGVQPTFVGKERPVYPVRLRPGVT